MEEDQIYEYELIPGFRASSKLLYIKDEEQIFKYKYNRNNIKYYYCYEKNCNVGIAVDLNNPIYCRKSGKFQTHNHGPQGELFRQLQVINAIKCKVKKGSSIKRSSVRDIFEQQCKKFKAASHAIEYGRMRRQLYNIKKQKFPKSPMSFSDILDVFKNEEVIQKFAMSRYDSEQKFYTDTIITENFSYALFVSPTISKAIQSMMSSPSEPRNYVMDATFNVVPTSKDFKQLLIIYFVHGEQAFPFIYVLMSKNTEEAYTHMLLYLKSNILDLQPYRVITDFENGFRNAIQKSYPTVKLFGSWFHYIQALRRKALKIPGFINELNKNNQAKVLFNKFLYLPLLKPNDITAAYEILKADAMNLKYIKGKMSEESYFQPFIKYFDSHWMKKEKVTNFSVYKKEPIRISFHSQLHMKPPKHDNFYRFLDCLCDLDRDNSSDFLKSISECTQENSYLEKQNKFIQKWYQLLREKKITLNTLLEQFSKMKNNCMIDESFMNTIDSNDDESDANSIGVDSTDIKLEGQHYLSCINCCERERQILFYPCKHFKLCQPCYKQLKESAGKKGTQTLCPICCAIINNGTFIYC